jgi:hypothetical protein
MKDGCSVPALVGCALASAALCTFVVDDGCLFWMPTLLALYGLTRVWTELSRRQEIGCQEGPRCTRRCS